MSARGGGYEQMNEIHLSVFHSVSNRTDGKHLSLPWLAMHSKFDFLVLSKRRYDIHVT